MSNVDVVKGLRPERLWYHFAKISEIPRGSKNEAAVMTYIRDFAKANNLDYSEDATGNIVIRKPAAPGCENYPGVILQGHTDMVCEKNKDTEHDFEKDPIRFVIDGDFLKASGTTLGADNGIGFCAALAVLEGDSIKHGPVEALFTVDEETGLTGAFNLDEKMLKHRFLLNMDSEEDGELYVGCAGGKDTVGKFTKKLVPVKDNREAFKLVITGLRGGHSGLDINNGLGNAIRYLARILNDLIALGELELFRIEGGSKRNAVPREAEAEFTLQKDLAGDLKGIMAKWEAIYKGENGDQEPGIKVVLEKTAIPKQTFDTDLTNRLIGAIFTVPHGVTEMSQSIPGLVQTSTNLATVEDHEDYVSVGTSQRSFIESAKDDIAERVAEILKSYGAGVETGKAYPGWKPNMASKTLKIAESAMTELSGHKPDIKAIHAGLECGIIGEKFPGMDMVSFGPTIMGAHSPDERVEIATVEKFWNYLLYMLANMDKAA